MTANFLDFLKKNYEKYFLSPSTYKTELNFDHFWGQYYWWIVAVIGLAIILFFLIVILINIAK